MKTAKELREERAELTNSLEKMVEVCKAEKRDFSDEENTKWSEAKKKIDELADQIKIAEEREALMAEAAQRKSEEVKPEERKGGAKTNAQKRAEELSKFSLLKAIRSQIPGEGYKAEGIEKEIYEEGINEARGAQVKQMPEGFAMPSEKRFREMIGEKRDLNVGTDADGGHTVQTTVNDIIPFLRANLQLESLGSNIMRGLMGDQKFPRGDAAGSGAWEGETDANAENSPTLDQFTLSPNRYGAYTVYSKQLLVQSSSDIERFVRNNLNAVISRGVEAALISGSGANQPTGLLDISGINSVSIGTNGGAPTFNHIVLLEEAIETDNANGERMAYLTTPGVKGKLKRTKIDSGSGQFVWAQDSRELNGYPAAVSTLVPSNLTKGSGSSLHAILFANWPDVMIGQWGGYDIVVDPYSNVKNAQVQVVVNTWWDINISHPEALAAVVDADVSGT